MSNGTSNNTLPKGIPYIIGNEAAERYSFYGMKAILIVFMTQFLGMENDVSKAWFHTFVFVTYFTPIIGAFISDVYWGKYRTIIRISIIYIIGHLVIAFFENKMGLFVGCTLIAFGSGGIKPCVSAHVGDQFKEDQSHMFERIFMYFYFAINAGSVVAYMTAEYFLTSMSPRVAFGIPGILMAIATFIFYLGRDKFISIKPAGWKMYKKELFSSNGIKTIAKLIPLYIFLAAFWSLFDQTGSAWVIQAQSDLMDKHIDLGFVDFSFFPSQIGFFNPLLIVIFIPIFSSIIYPFLKKVIPFNYSTKITIGMFLAVIPFGILSWVQGQMDAGISMSIMWQVLAYVLLTASEIMVSVTALEFSYTQAPNKMKSFIMSFYLLSIALGNLFTALVNVFIQNADGSSKLAGASYFWFFTVLMFVASIAFLLYGRKYKEESFVQPEEDIEVIV